MLVTLHFNLGFTRSIYGEYAVYSVDILREMYSALILARYTSVWRSNTRRACTRAGAYSDPVDHNFIDLELQHFSTPRHHAKGSHLL